MPVCRCVAKRPNIQAHLPGRLESLQTLGNQYAGPVRCSALFGGYDFCNSARTKATAA
jgi:hypothetical protein